jgi:predicted DNA-binding protein (UPF0251 family)
MAIATFEDVCRAYENRPPLLREALARAYVHPEFRSLSRETLGVMLSLVARLSHFKPAMVFAARADRCAQEVGVSRKTFARAINRFIGAGWLTEAGGGRTPSGRFGAFRYRFTQDFLALLGLDEVRRKPTRTTLSHGSLSIDVHLKEDHVPAATPTTPPAINPLPQDVQPLAARGVHPLLVYRLMGMATRAGYRLGDVVAVALPYLQKIGATGWRAYRYLESMLTKGVGYQGRAESLRDQEQRQRQQEKAASLMQTMQGSRWVTSDGVVVWVDGYVAYHAYPDGRVCTAAGEQAIARVAEAIEARVLIPVS